MESMRRDLFYLLLLQVNLKLALIFNFPQFFDFKKLIIIEFFLSSIIIKTLNSYLKINHLEFN